MPVIATPTAVQTGGCTDQPNLPGAANPAPLPVSCIGQSILAPATPKDASTGKAILTRTFAVEIRGQQKATIQFTMRDRQGTPVDLSHCACEPDGSLSLSVSDSDSDDDGTPECMYRLVFRMAEYLSGGGKEYAARYVDAKNGVVAVDLMPDDTKLPGIYFGEFALVEEDIDPTTGDSVVVFSNKFYVNIGRNLWNNRMHCQNPLGPPSISEVRMFLRDSSSDESYLLDNVAFTDEEIMQATWMPIAYWNETPPPVAYHSTATFPYRYNWLMAITGYLFLIVAEQQRRNNLQYSAAGVQVNDQNREMNYEQAAQNKLNDWKLFVRAKKVEINLANAYGGI